MQKTILRFPFPTDDEKDCDLVGHHFSATDARTGILQVLVHGNSYDHRYWDAGRVNGKDYSYVNYMVERGYDVLAVDLPGTGDSGRPTGDGVGFDHVGKALSEAVTRTRDELGQVDKIALVGHSLGTILAVYMQARWPIADVLVCTGVGFSSSLLPSPYGPGVRENALLDPYPSVAPDLRREVFYHAPGVDPNVVAYDNEVLRTSLPRRLWADSIAIRNDPERAGLSRIACPVLIQLGEFDPVLPGSYADTERDFWPANTNVTVEQVDGMAHCLNLHHDPQRGWESIDRFLRNES